MWWHVFCFSCSTVVREIPTSVLHDCSGTDWNVPSRLSFLPTRAENGTRCMHVHLDIHTYYSPSTFPSILRLNLARFILSKRTPKFGTPVFHQFEAHPARKEEDELYAWPSAEFSTIEDDNALSSICDV